MKLILNSMKRRIVPRALAILLSATVNSPAQTLVGAGGEHVDIGIAYDSDANEWELHVHDESNDLEYFPATDALLFIGSAAQTTVPEGTQWSFLGSAGSESWILPNAPTSGLMLLGFGAEEITAGMFDGDEFTLSLKAVSGPGSFSVFDLDTFNTPLVLMNSDDGLSSGDSLTLPIGAHRDVNFAFSAPGDYTITFEASGISTQNGLTSSGDVNYTFRVEAIPEPASSALVGVSALAWLLVRRRTN